MSFQNLLVVKVPRMAKGTDQRIVCGYTSEQPRDDTPFGLNETGLCKKVEGAYPPREPRTALVRRKTETSQVRITGDF